MANQATDALVFSMCNCVTLGMPGVYTAHALTMDLFLTHAYPGSRWARPHTNLWPETFIRVFKFPPNPMVFAFSIFNEVYLPSYIWKKGDLDRFTLGFDSKYDAIRALSHPVALIKPRDFAQRLLWVGRKAEQIWPGIHPVLVHYDKTRAPIRVQRVFARYEAAVESSVCWPVVRVLDPVGPPPNPDRPHLWCHYTPEARDVLYRQILKAAGLSNVFDK